MNITLDKQVLDEECPECQIDFTVVRGGVYDSAEPIGLYLIGLHGHSPDGRLGHLAISLLDRSTEPPRPFAAAMNVIGMPHQFGYVLVEWEFSPWGGEFYLGEMLQPDQVRESSFRDIFFHIAEHVTADLPESREYFSDP